jgi:cytochrome d ubiquinol oxidase subunit I
VDVVTLSRLQFGLTVSFHYIFPSITIGLAWLIAWMMWRHLRTGERAYWNMARFWLSIFTMSFIVGIGSGVAMSFQFGTNWAGFSMVTGQVFGAPLMLEVLFAFFIESVFLGILIFAHERLSARAQWFCSLMVAVGATLSGFWIVAANSWMQTPAGYSLDSTGFHLERFWGAVFSPSTIPRFLHVISGVILSGSMFAMGLAAWYLLRGRHIEFARRSLRIALMFSVVSALGMLGLGHYHAVQVAHTQPVKLAAVEGLFDTKTRAPLCVFGIPNRDDGRLDKAVAIPGLLSLGAFGSMDAEVKGLNDFPKEDWPPLIPTFVTFHLMVALGMYFILLTLFGIFLLWRKRLYQSRLFLTLALLSIPLPIIANELGWATAELGRQPWIVYDVLRTTDGVSAGVPGGHVLLSTIMFCAVYALLFAAWLMALRRKLGEGPEPVGDKSPGQ